MNHTFNKTVEALLNSQGRLEPDYKKYALNVMCINLRLRPREESLTRYRPVKARMAFNYHDCLLHGKFAYRPCIITPVEIALLSVHT